MNHAKPTNPVWKMKVESSKGVNEEMEFAGFFLPFIGVMIQHARLFINTRLILFFVHKTLEHV